MATGNKIVLVTGATGAIGPCVVRELHNAGYHVRTMSLPEPAPVLFPHDVETYQGDISDPTSIQSIMENVDAVIHLAALLHVVNPSPELRSEYERINVGGTEAVVAAAIKANVKRIVLFSTISVYGCSSADVPLLDEDSPVRPDTFYAQTKLAAEQIILNVKGADGQPLGSVLRLAAVYGPRIKGNYGRLVQSLARGRFIPIGDGLNRRTLVYNQDAARAAVLAISHPDAAGEVFNVTDGQFHTMEEIIAAICAALGLRPPRFSLPVAPIRSVVSLLENAANIIGFESPIVRATIDKYLEDMAVSGEKIRRILGFYPEFDLGLGWRETVREMNQNGELRMPAKRAYRQSKVKKI